MTKLSNADEIWILNPTIEDLIAGAEYAAITLPWTFNRMMKNRGSFGVRERALNIAKGIVAQETLRRELTRRGIHSSAQRKSHRDEDLFDLNVDIRGTIGKLDVKTGNFYTNYASLGREALSAKLIINNSSYAGPDWRHFFPMLIPHTQVEQKKDAYCFALASSIDFRRDIDTNRSGYALTAFPYGEPHTFLTSKRLCLEREEAGQGFYLECSYPTLTLFSGSEVNLTIIGEWNRSIKRVSVRLEPGSNVSGIGPFSCISSFQISREDLENLDSHIEISVAANDFMNVIRNSLRQNINLEPEEVLMLGREDFCNLVLPDDYVLYFVGWIPKEEFIQQCRDYTGWVWPFDRVNKFENQAWTTISDKDKKTLTKAGFADCIQKKPALVKAGWMKTTGKGGGACCYTYPNIGRGGGLRETNLYVLPKDLYIMDELGKAKVVI